MSKYQGDPVDQIVENLIPALLAMIWTVIAVAGSLVFRLFRKSPEKRLRDQKADRGWGNSAQVKQCPACQAINNADTPLCSMCGARL